MKPPLPAVQPGFPCTVGEMLGLLANSGDSRFRRVMQVMQQKIPTEALATDLNQVLPNMISLLKHQTTIP